MAFLSSLNCCLAVFLLLFSGVFSNVIRYSKRIEILLLSASFCRPKSIINPFLPVRLLSRGKKKKVNSSFVISFNTSQVEFFLLIVFF